jgi:hypothetical protein
MLQDTDFFTNLETPLTIGDVLPTVVWSESVSPDERYLVTIVWRFRGDKVGEGTFVIEPILDSEQFRVYWVHLGFIEDWQAKGLYSTIVEQLSPYLYSHGIVEVWATPWNKEAEGVLASRGFAWRGPEFVLILGPSST